MRRVVLAAAATFALMAAGPMTPDRAEGAPLSTPAGIQAAIDETDLVQAVAYICRRAWRCGPTDCGWRRVCTWSGWRPHWRTRQSWRRHDWSRHYW